MFVSILWCVFAEVITKITPVPKKILQNEDKAERSRLYFRHISNLVSLVYGTITFVLATWATLVCGIQRGQPTREEHKPSIIVSSLPHC